MESKIGMLAANILKIAADTGTNWSEIPISGVHGATLSAFERRGFVQNRPKPHWRRNLLRWDYINEFYLTEAAFLA